MSEVASRELRNNTRWVLARVESGERITITVGGRPVADLVPVASRSRWMSRERFVREVLAHQADPALSTDLAQLTDETTDDLTFK